MWYLTFRYPNAGQLHPQKTVYQAQSSLKGSPEERACIELVPQHYQALHSSICNLQPGNFLDPFPSAPKTKQTKNK